MELLNDILNQPLGYLFVTMLAMVAFFGGMTCAYLTMLEDFVSLRKRKKKLQMAEQQLRYAVVLFHQMSKPQKRDSKGRFIPSDESQAKRGETVDFKI